MPNPTVGPSFEGKYLHHRLHVSATNLFTERRVLDELKCITLIKARRFTALLRRARALQEGRKNDDPKSHRLSKYRRTEIDTAAKNN